MTGKYLLSAGIVICVLMAGCPANDDGDNANLNLNANENSANANSSVNDNAANENSSGSQTAPLLYPAVWQRTDGTLFGTTKAELAYMVLNDDATVQFYHRHPSVGYVMCSAALFEQGQDLITFGFGGHESRSELVAYELPDADTLELRSVEGEEAVFTRATLPDDVECLELEVLNTYTDLPRPIIMSGLAWDANYFWYTNSDALLQSVAPDGTLGMTLDLGFDIAHAYQGNALWLLSTTDVEEHLARRLNVFGVQQDEVDTDALGSRTDLRCLAYDDVNHILWLSGFASESDAHQLLRVNSDAEPDVLLGAEPFGALAGALACDGVSLWLLVGDDDWVIEVDPATLSPLHTYVTPDSWDWVGLAWVDGSLYLIGSSGSTGVLVETRP